MNTEEKTFDSTYNQFVHDTVESGGVVSPALEKTFINALDAAYCQGIDHAIKSIENYCEKLRPYSRSGNPYLNEPHITALISQLKELKK